MTELKRISDGHIKEIRYRFDNHYYPLWEIYAGERIAQAQLEADQEAVGAIVQEIFEEIEERLFTHDGDGNLILTSAPPRDRVVIWWQALKRKYVKKVKDD